MSRFVSRLFLFLALAGVTATAFAQQEIIGAGATFPYPLYSKMFDVYSKEYGVKVNYQPIGSGGGIRQLINRTVDFGASDVVMGEEDMKAAGAPVLHIPVCAGAVVITYNLPGNPEIKLTPDLIADIFLGKNHEMERPEDRIGKTRVARSPICPSRLSIAPTAAERRSSSATT